MRKTTRHTGRGRRKNQRRKKTGPCRRIKLFFAKRGKHTLIWAVQILCVCILAAALVWFFGQRISNAGDSMKPGIKNGDVVLVNRIVYNARKPKRGDVIVFLPDGNSNAHYLIKRVVGLPGEEVQIKDGAVYINGKKQSLGIHAKGLDYAGTAQNPVTLGEDEYFVIGDNAKSSDDSRMADVGSVKRKDIVGKAWFIVSPGDTFGYIG